MTQSSISDTKTPASRLQSRLNFVIAPKSRQTILQQFSNLPITRKTQVISLLILVSLGGIVGLESIALVGSLRNQLLDQAKSQLAVTEINYNSKIEQIEFAFRTQSESADIIIAAETHAKGESLTPELQTRVTEILQNEIKEHKIEYATLVGKDLKIIGNANAQRTGETFNPNNLVTQVLQHNQPIKTTEIVSWSELAKESTSLPDGFTNQDGLIRYTLIPVKQPGTKNVLGVLIAGEIINAKLDIVKKTVNIFADQGYSAIYLHQLTGGFALATSIEKTNSLETKVNIPLSNTSLLTAAVEAEGESVTKRLPVENRTYTLAAKALTNTVGDPVAVLVYGNPEIALSQIIKNTLITQVSLSLIVLAVVVFLARAIGHTIAQPLNRLQEITQEFSQGNYQLRAEALTTDETGKLARTFNEMADSIEANLKEIDQKENLLLKNAQEQRQLKEVLQRRALELLMEVDPISQGDLTIRAKVTEDEIGTIADSYNATVANLRKIVTQVQTAATQVADTTSTNESVVKSLSTEALRQAEEIAVALERVQEMAQLVQVVASSAKQAEAAVQQAARTVEEGDANMNRTVDGIVSIRETVAETAKKVKRLGESSQKISQVVNLISNFTEQTNMLALNASIEAAQAGKEGRGFAIIAQEVRKLAKQSAQATIDIEKLIAELQEETNEVIATMETSTEEVVTGTKLVDETRQSLNQITAASNEINQLVEAIAQSTILQSQVSEIVTKTMTDIAAISAQTSTEASTVSSSFEQLRQVAQALQEEVGQFKIS